MEDSRAQPDVEREMVDDDFEEEDDVEDLSSRFNIFITISELHRSHRRYQRTATTTTTTCTRRSRRTEIILFLRTLLEKASHPYEEYTQDFIVNTLIESARHVGVLSRRMDTFELFDVIKNRIYKSCIQLFSDCIDPRTLVCICIYITYAYTASELQCVSKKTSPTFLAVTRESIVGFS